MLIFHHNLSSINVVLLFKEKEFQLLQEQFHGIVQQMENVPKEDKTNEVLESLETQNVKLKHRIEILKEVSCGLRNIIFEKKSLLLLAKISNAMCSS